MSARMPFVAALALASACAPAPRPPNVLLITVDTLRADRLPLLAAAPGLRELCDEALVFEGAQSPRAKTTPALASLMTGLYPHEHGVRELLQPLAPGSGTLARELRASGWSTAAIVGNFVLADARSGLAPGFEQWTEELPDTQRVPPEDVPERRAGSLTDGALVALGLERWQPGQAGPRASFVAGDKPWFLWLHYMDPHGSYDPPAAFAPVPPLASEWLDPAALAAETGEPRPWLADYNVPAAARRADGCIDAAAVRAHYDGEVRYVAAEIGRLLQRLRVAGQLENTLVILTSDHGESLGEQRYWFEHGRNTSEVTCRVPLLVRLPGGRAGRVAGDLSLCDLAPTLVEHLGLPPLVPRAAGAVVRGRSRAELWRGGGGASAPVFCEKLEGATLSGAVQHKAVRLGSWKLVRRYAQHFGDQAGARPALRVVGDELYDLARDPAEEHNLIAAPPAGAPLPRLEAELLRFAAADVRFADLARKLAGEREGLEQRDPETLRILKALGY